MNSKGNPDARDPNDGPGGKREFTLRPGGGYRKLRSFQTATVIYDATVSFCERFIDKRSRLVDQMVQAARSGRQNIAEGSSASTTSSQTELRLVNVARASLDELLLDYEDYLRQHRHRQWTKDDPEALAVRQVGREHKADWTDPADPADPTTIFGPYTRWLNSSNPAVVANTMLCLIHQANYLLDQQVAALERLFIHEGGYSEQIAAARYAERNRQLHGQADQTAQADQTDRTDRTDQSDQTDRTDRTHYPQLTPPNCPNCAKPMVLRTAHKGENAGLQFWGCVAYPACKGTKRLIKADRADRTDQTDLSDQTDHRRKP